MTTTLITGVNTGLGKKTTRLLLAAGHTVYVGAREVGELVAPTPGARRRLPADRPTAAGVTRSRHRRTVRPKVHVSTDPVCPAEKRTSWP
jgi:NAD(P)-dependent dehydrogenase (short-subunit alcohol dehydrogenase family)